MKRRLLIAMVSCLPVMGMQAETVRVMRFVAVDGAESEVTLSSLQKVVFTADSMVLVSAKGEETTPMYKYDYRSILFTESGSEEGIEGVQSTDRSADRVQKYIKDGYLYIRLDGHVYNILGGKVL